MAEDHAASSDRTPTDSPGRYLIPADQVPPRLAERLAGAHEPVPARPAATIVLARESRRGPEVLLLRRPGRSSFAANAWVFPGGAVDRDDSAATVAERLLGPPAHWWAERLRTEAAHALGFVAAALREAWEETGILLADPLPPRERLSVSRAELLGGAVSLADIVRSHDLRLDAREVVYLAHWITPEQESRRYDTRFFLAHVSQAAECDLVGEELCEARWVAPAEAVEAYHAAKMRLLPPTVHTLQRLSAYGSVPEMTAALRHGPVPAILPRMTASAEGVLIEIPEG